MYWYSLCGSSFVRTQASDLCITINQIDHMAKQWCESITALTG